MNALNLITRLRQHQRWVFQQLLMAARGATLEQLKQPFEIGPGSLWATLLHLYNSEYMWLGAIEGDMKAPPPAAPDSLDALGTAWKALDLRWRGHYETWTQADLDRTIAKARFTNPGPPLYRPLGDVLLHLGTHSYYHAAQAINILRRLGLTPLPDTMLITMNTDQPD